jgi:branched-chain amino acid aminotransferase
MAPVMASAIYKDELWGDLEIMPYGPIQMAPSAKVLHYAQEVFEGMKAYKVDGNGPFIFRPEENFKRINLSAQRLAMPEIPHDIFMNSVLEVTALCAKFIPKKSGESLYLRPFMFASEEALGIRPADQFRYMLIASPSGSYFSGSNSLSVLIEREGARAFPHGTGYAKTGGNYAASLLSAAKAKKLGCAQTLWLDGREKKFIEEMSGMNFFAVINNNLHTPQMSDTILDGITRKSLIYLAKDLGIKVIEEKMAINDLIKLIKTGECTEAFACGTAAIINPIDVLMEDNKESYKLLGSDGPMANMLREKLLAIQEGRAEDKYHWVTKVEAKN